MRCLATSLLCLSAGCLPKLDDTPADPNQVSTGPSAPELPTTATLATGTALLFEDDLIDAVLATLQSADTRIHVAQYTLWEGATVQPLYDALADAAARGVEVQVLADEASSDTPGLLAELAGAGASTQLDDPAVTLHNKLWIIDDVVYTGSHNLSTSALTSNREASVRLTDPTAVEHFAQWFATAWDDPSGTTEPWSVPQDSVLVADADVAAASLYCLDHATERVRLGMYAFAWSADYPGEVVDQLMVSLQDAHARGVDVHVLLDDSAWISDNHINTAAVAALEQAGVPVRTAPTTELVHAKVLVCDNTLLVSDANWSYSGLTRYRGTTARLQDSGLANELAGWIDALWEAGAPP